MKQTIEEYIEEQEQILREKLISLSCTLANLKEIDNSVFEKSIGMSIEYLKDKFER